MHERAGASVTVVLDPVDGSTNCSRGISYWAISICALDADGPLAGARREPGDRRAHAPRSAAQGAYRDGVRAARVERDARRRRR